MLSDLNSEYTLQTELSPARISLQVSAKRQSTQTHLHSGELSFFKYDFCHNIPITGEGPDLDRIYIAPAGSMEEQVIEAENGRLTGTARILTSSRLESGKYVTGLGYANGAVEFDNIEVPEDGEYTLTLGTRKNGEYEKIRSDCCQFNR